MNKEEIKSLILETIKENLRVEIHIEEYDQKQLTIRLFLDNEEIDWDKEMF